MTAVSKEIERVQTGVRIEKRVLQVLKAISARNDMGLGDLIEGIVYIALKASPLSGKKHCRLLIKCDPPTAPI